MGTARESSDFPESSQKNPYVNYHKCEKRAETVISHPFPGISRNLLPLGPGRLNPTE